MPAWLPVLLWWSAFAGTHLLLSSLPVRQPLIARLGARGFQVLYSVVALATFIPLVRNYWAHKHAGPLLWALGSVPGVHPLSLALSALGFAFIVGALVQPSPTSFVPGAAVRAYGLTRITRHSLFTGMALWGLAHCLVNGFLSDVIFFGGFAIYGTTGAVHQDKRKQVIDADTLRIFYTETSLVPFAAIVSGRTRFVTAEMPWAGILLGLAVATAIYILHPWLFMG